MNFADIVSNMDKKIPFLFLFAGNDSIGLDKARMHVFEALSLRYPDLQIEKFDQSEETIQQFCEHMLEGSLFQTKRLFQIRHCHHLTQKDLTIIAKTIGQPIPDVYVILEASGDTGIKSGKTFIEQLDFKKKTKKYPDDYVSALFELPPAYKTAAWLIELVPRLFGRTCTKAVAEKLIDLVGTNCDRIYSELQKLDIVLPANSPITNEAVTKIVGSTNTASIFDLGKLVASIDIKGTFALVDGLFTQNQPLTLINGALFSYFWKLGKIIAYKEENQAVMASFYKTTYKDQMTVAHSIAVACSILQPKDPVNKSYPIMILSGLMDQAQKYTLQQCTLIYRILAEFDTGIKTGAIDHTKDSLELLCLRIVSVLKTQPQEKRKPRERMNEVFLSR